MNSDDLLIKTKSSKVRNEKILDLIFDLEANKTEVIETFDKKDLDADKKGNDPIFIDFKKLSTLNLDTDFLWNLYSYRSSKKPQHESMKMSYFLWCEKSEEIFIKLLEYELKGNTRNPFLLIINSIIFNYKFDSYIELFKKNKDTLYHILKYYLHDGNVSTFSLKEETKIPKHRNSIFQGENIEYINQALNIYFLNFI